MTLLHQCESTYAESVPALPSVRVARWEDSACFRHLPLDELGELSCVRAHRLGPCHSALHAPPCSEHFRGKARAILQCQEARDIAIGERAQLFREAADREKRFAVPKGGRAH